MYSSAMSWTVASRWAGERVRWCCRATSSSPTRSLPSGRWERSGQAAWEPNDLRSLASWAGDRRHRIGESLLAAGALKFRDAVLGDGVGVASVCGNEKVSGVVERAAANA